MKSFRQFTAFIVLLLVGITLLTQPIPSAAQTTLTTANPDASSDAKAILSYLQGLPLRPDKKLISGQFESWGRAVLPLSDPTNNLAIIHEKTGKWVGLVGVEYHQGGVFPDAPNRLCTEFWRRGGLVQLYLIMRNPADPNASNGGGHCDIDPVLDPAHPYHKFFFDEMDQIASGLGELQKNGVVVFLNPFAEASGDWFWWGNQPPGKFKALYRATFDYLVKTKHLNNLLFIYEPSSSHRTAAAYYPGNNYADMIGISIFVASNHELVPSDIPAYDALAKFNKPLAFSQWGPRRGADQVGKDEPPADNTKLLRGIRDYFPRATWWMNWNMAYALSSPTNSNYNDRQLLEDPMVINLDDLNWKTGGK